MTDLKNMSVDNLLLEVLKHKGTPSNPGITWREAFDELARRLREQEQLYKTTREALAQTSEQQEEQLRQRAEQAEVELEQMKTRAEKAESELKRITKNETN